MKRKRYKEEQIVRILGEIRRGQTVAATCRKYGVSEQTVYRWRSKYGSLEVSEVRRMKEMEEENRRLRHVVSQQAIDIDLLKEINAKKW